MKHSFDEMCNEVSRILDEDTVCDTSKKLPETDVLAAEQKKDTELATEKGEDADGVLKEKSEAAFPDASVVRCKKKIVWDAPNDPALEPGEIDKYSKAGFIEEINGKPTIVFPEGTEFNFHAADGDPFFAPVKIPDDCFWFDYKPEYCANKYLDYFELVGARNLHEDDDEEHIESEEMTLDDAIDHLKDSLADPEHDWSCNACKHEHEQLLGWLEELKQIKDGEVVSGEESDEETGVSSNGAICMTVPLFLRLLEYAKEDAESDLDLHCVAENVLRLAADPGIIGMDDYAEIIDIYEEDDEDDGEEEDGETFGEAKKKKKKKYKKSKSNYLGRWGRYFPRIPWIVPARILPPPPPGPKPPPPPKPEDVTPAEVPTGEPGGDVNVGPADTGGMDGGAAGPVGESKIMDTLNKIDVKTLKSFIVKEFGSKFLSQKDITSGQGDTADAIEITSIASPVNCAALDDDASAASAILFVKFKTGDGEWTAVVLFDGPARKFYKVEFVAPEYAVFQTGDKTASGAAAFYAKAFPEIYEIKKF